MAGESTMTSTAAAPARPWLRFDWTMLVWLTLAAILLVEPHHGMGGRPGTGEEIQNHRIRFFLYKKTQRIFDGEKRFGKREPAIRDELGKNRRTTVFGVVGRHIPDSLWNNTLSFSINCLHCPIRVATNDFNAAILDCINCSTGQIVNSGVSFFRFVVA